MDQCEKLEAFMDQGHIKRVAGKLRWSDGSNIIREPDETWVNAILKRVQADNKARDEEKRQKGKEVYFINVGREESDADTDDQEEMGWESVSAPIHHLQSFGADRPSRVSRDSRKGVQNIPTKPHRMREFPSRREDNSLRREKNIISKDVDPHRSQDRPFTPAVPTPVDVTPERFKGEVDDELVPMDIEDTMGNQSINDKGQVSARKEKNGSRDLLQIGPKTGKTQSAIVDEVLNSQLTIRVQELIYLSPNVRRALAKACRTTRDDDAEGIDMTHFEERKEPSKKEKRGKEVMRADAGPGRVIESQVEEEESESDKLLKIIARIGKARMVGVVDSGSSRNIISARMAAATGLPTVLLKDKSFPVQGISGPPTRYRYKIPQAAIYVTDNKLLTTGDLYVVEGAKVDLLYGLPWLDKHNGSIYKQPEGTFVSWVSEGQHHAINATAWEYGDSDYEEETHHNRGKREGRGTFISMMARVKSPATDLSYAPEEDQEPLFTEDYPDDEDDDEEAREAVRWARKEVEEWERKKRREEGEREDERESSPPPGQSRRRKGKDMDRRATSKLTKTSSKRRKTGKSGRGFVEVDRDLEEDFARMDQEEAGEEEWAKFCQREKRRMARKDKDWLTWIQRESDDEAPAGIDEDEPHFSNEQDPVMDPRESIDETWALPSESTPTLETPPQKSPKRATRSIVPRTLSPNTETTARRSRRVRWLTEKGQYGEQMKRNGQTYQRSERATRTVSQTAQPARKSDTIPIEDEEPQIFSLCLQASPTQKGRGKLSTRRKDQLTSRQEAQHEPESYPPSERKDENSPLGSESGSSHEIKELETGNEADTEDDEEDESAYLSDDPSVGTSKVDPEGSATGKQSALGVFFEDQLAIAEGDTNPERESDQTLTRSKCARLNSKGLGLADATGDQPEKEIEPYLLNEDEETVDEGSPSKSRKEGSQRTKEETKAVKGGCDPNANGIAPVKAGRKSRNHGIRGLAEGTNLERDKGETSQGGKLLPPTDASREVTETSPDPIIGRVTKRPRQAHDVSEMRERDRRPIAGFEGDDDLGNENVREGCIVCGRSEPSPIKARGGGRRKARTTSWLPKVPKFSRTAKVAWKVLALFFLIFLLLAAIGHLSRPHPPINVQLTMHFRTIPLPPDESSSNGSHPLIPSSQSDESRLTYPPAPRTREPDGSPFSDLAKEALDSLHAPSGRYMTPAIIAINHLEPLTVQSSHPTHEFLGRGITVSIRNPNGHVLHHQGDLHLRLFLRGVENGWKDISLPSRTEVDHLIGLWNREPGYQGAMAQIRTDFDRVRLISDDPPSERSTWQTFEEREEEMEEVEEGEMSKVPPNSPDKSIRIGPPSTKEGQRARRRHPFPKRFVPTDSSSRNSGLEKLAEAADKVREEEEGDAPFRNGVLARSSPIAEIEMAPLPQGSPPEIPPPPPDLTYPDDGNGRSCRSGSSGKVTEFSGQFNNPAGPDDDDPPPPLVPASPPPITLKRGRPSRAVLSDILLCLYKLRFELGIAFDIETQGMIEKMETSTHQLLMMDVAKGSSEARSRIAGPDGDIEMGERGRAVSEGPGRHSAIPTEYSLSPASLSRFDELMDRVRTLQGMILSYQWKKFDDQNELGEKVDRLEARIASLEVLRVGEETVTNTRRRNHREPPERPLTRSNTHRLEHKVDQCVRAINTLQTRITEAEAALDSLRGTKEGILEAERRIVRMEGAIGKQDTKFANLVARIDEVLLRQGSAARDPPAPHQAPSPGFYLRISRIESNLLNFNQRISSNEEQLSLVEQRLRGFWIIGASSNPADAVKQVAHLRHVWATATLAWNQRHSQGNPSITYSQPTHPLVPITTPGTSNDHASVADDDPPKPNAKPGQY